MRPAIALAVLCLVLSTELPAAEPGPTLYVNNLVGNDANDGSRDKPLASIEKALALVQTSGRVEVDNTGTPYQLPYDGPKKERGLRILKGGTLEHPLVVDGNGAVVTGLAVIPATAWKDEGDRLYSLPFDPFTNGFRREKTMNHWLPGTQIWFVDGAAAPNVLSREEVEKTPNGFWWEKFERRLFYRLPDGRNLADLKIEIPANYGFYIHRDHTVVQNFIVAFSWNDGFDAAETPKNGVFKNCLAYNNCGQGMSLHDGSSVYYEDCGAVNCASTALTNVHYSSGSYKRCVFVNSTFEATVLVAGDAVAQFEECLIAEGAPSEQVWQRGRSKLVFNNCVVIGTGKTNLLSLDAGGASFFGCTLLNGTGFCSMEGPNHAGTLSVAQSVFKDFQRYYVKFPDALAHRKLQFTKNHYADKTGHYLKGKTETPGASPALAELKLDAGAVVGDLALDGRKNSEIPGAPDRRSQRVGARLPDGVWQLYDRLTRFVATPAGLRPVEE